MYFFEGWINLYKPKNISSFGAIKKIKKRFNFTKIGHAGTLDPNAEGVLPLAVGKTTKLISFVSDHRKSYEFEIMWGKQTTTDDNEGDTIAESKNIPSQTKIKNKLEELVGDISQKPPKLSAVKINGKRAYKRFFNNEEFETKERYVKIYKLNFLDQTAKNISKIYIECSKGFYVRSFARDLGQMLNSKAHMYSLIRTRVGKFSKENSILLDDLLKIRQMAYGIKGFFSSVSVLDDIPAFEIDSDEMLKNISLGKEVKVNLLQKKSSIVQSKKFFFAIKKEKIISFGILDKNSFKPKKVLL